MGAVECACAEDDLLSGVDHPDLAVPLELDPVGGLGGPVHHDLGDHGVHGDVEVLPVADGPEEGLGRAAPGAASQGALRDHETRLVGAVPVTVLVAAKRSEKK